MWAPKKIGDQRKLSDELDDPDLHRATRRGSHPGPPAGNGDQHVEHRPDRGEDPVRRIEGRLGQPAYQAPGSVARPISVPPPSTTTRKQRQSQIGTHSSALRIDAAIVPADATRRSRQLATRRANRPGAGRRRRTRRCRSAPATAKMPRAGRCARIRPCPGNGCPTARDGRRARSPAAAAETHRSGRGSRSSNTEQVT